MLRNALAQQKKKDFDTPQENNNVVIFLPYP
jgi:hypothetical protein